MALLGAGMGLLPYYLARGMPTGRTTATRLALTWGFAAIVDGALWAAAGSWISSHLLSRLPELARLPFITEKALPFLLVFGVLLYLACAAFYYLLLAQDQAEEAEQARLTLQLLAQEAELKALRAQLNPHFLFNALNSISALTSLDPLRARDMCVRLSDFLPEGGEVRLEAHLEGTSVQILVENPVDPDAPRPQGLGLGLKQVRQRLLGRFGEGASFEAGITDGRYAVRLRFPLQTERP